MIQVQKRFVTFIPPKDAAYLIGDFTDGHRKPLRINGPITLEFPQGAYVEYAFLDAHLQPVDDLTNPERPKNPWYDYHRTIMLPDNRFEAPPRPKSFRGSIVKHAIKSKIFSAPRIYYVYEPSVFPLTTVYVHDGEAFYQKLQFHQVAEALLEPNAIKPTRLVFIEPNDREAEYWFNERYEAFLLEEMLPEVDSRYGATEERGLWGASLGGLVSVWLAWRNPQVFSKVGSQSGCFTAHPEGKDEYHDPEWLTEQLAISGRRPLRFYVQTGQIEWLLAPNRRFAAMLVDKAYVHLYQEQPGGHNWATWEQGLVPGLMYLFDRSEGNM